MAALTFKGLLPPATGAIRAVPRYAHVVAREEWERMDNLPDMGLDGEKPPTNEFINQINGWTFLPPRAGRNFFGPCERGR
jgi:hypothetical protein